MDKCWILCYIWLTYTFFTRLIIPRFAFYKGLRHVNIIYCVHASCKVFSWCQVRIIHSFLTRLAIPRFAIHRNFDQLVWFTVSTIWGINSIAETITFFNPLRIFISKSNYGPQLLCQIVDILLTLAIFRRNFLTQTITFFNSLNVFINRNYYSNQLLCQIVDIHATWAIFGRNSFTLIITFFNSLDIFVDELY